MAAVMSTSLVSRPCLTRSVSRPFTASSRPRNLRYSMLVRAEAPEAAPVAPKLEATGPAEDAVPVAASAATAGGTGSTVAVQDFRIFSPTTEAINGRAAMLGFAVAVLSEIATGQSVWSQIAGKMVNEEYVERATGLSGVTFAAAVTLLTFATFAPMVLNQEGIASRSFGPFKPGLETTLGRIAMLGFSGLVLTETLRGNTALF